MRIVNFFKNRFALSEKGAKSLIGGIFFTLLLNLALMLPAVFMFLFLSDYLQPVIKPESTVMQGFWYYTLMAIAFISATFIIALYQYKNTFINVYTESANRRINLAEKLRKLPLAFFGEKNLSDLTATIMEDNTILEHTFSHSVPQLFASIISILLISTGLFFYNWQLALSLFWVIPIALLIIVLAKKMLGKAMIKHYNTKRSITEQIQEGLENIQEIKSYNGEQYYIDSFNKNLKNYEKALVEGELLAGILINISNIILKLGLPTVIIVGAYLLAEGSTNMFTYLIFLMVATTIYNPISEVFNNMAALQMLDVRINRMRDMEQMPVQQGETKFETNSYDISFENVGFSYETGKEVLKDVSFTAKQGEVTALIGSSGGGKTTSAKLAARFWDIQKGKITLGGKDISKIDPETLLENYSVVFQDVVLFNTSIKDNIKIGKQNATDQEIKKVAKLAQCDEFINQLPNGYDTQIGENGETLSGGERQRISIARALLKNAPIVLLDEATASLDVENETKIQAGITQLIKNKTVLIIAHRMRTVANADKIVVLKNGKVAEQGSPSELIKQNGEFAKMVERQTGKLKI